MNRRNHLASRTWGRIEGFWFRPVDARIYALWRMGFALVALLNLVDLWPHRAAFFSTEGIVDGETFLGPPYDPMRWSLFEWIGSEAGVTAVFLLVAVALVCLGIGWWPRVMIALVFAFQVSYTYRAVPVVHGWDILLRIQAFLLLFSPLGPSLIAWWKQGRGEGDDGSRLAQWAAEVPRYGLLLVQWQVAVLYWQTAWLKVADVSWRNGEFISYFMLSIYSRFQGPEWADRVLLSSVLTYATLVIEIAIPLLLWNRKTRWLGFVLGAGLHLSILVVAKVWLFSLAVLVPYVAFLDGRDLDHCTRWWDRRRGKEGPSAEPDSAPSPSP